MAHRPQDTGHASAFSYARRSTACPADRRCSLPACTVEAQKARSPRSTALQMKRSLAALALVSKLQGSRSEVQEGARSNPKGRAKARMSLVTRSLDMSKKEIAVTRPFVHDTHRPRTRPSMTVMNLISSLAVTISCRAILPRIGMGIGREGRMGRGRGYMEAINKLHSGYWEWQAGVGFFGEGGMADAQGDK